ncbi:MAG: DUF1579 domain-containing protein [Phycisphaerae bacterium]|nr:DUF1579 domain-containing protein [Phycisphaerae bacterium]
MMTRRFAVVAAAVGLAFVAGRNWPGPGSEAAAQPPKPETKPAAPAKPEVKPAQPPAPPPAGGPDMEALMASMTPGEHHKVLDVMLGTWEGDVKFWMAPGTDPMTSRGTAKREWAMDGRFVIEHVDATSQDSDMRFKGMGIIGYNNVEKRYETAWIENMSTAITTSTGTYDPATKVFTYEGEMYDPMTMKKSKVRTTVDVSDPKKEIMRGYGAGPDGKEFMNFEGVFTKKD